MRIDLSKYLTDRYLESQPDQDFEGPVLTIAREFGCPAKKLASRLASQLTKMKGPGQKAIDWRWINKEILSESAKELQVDPSEIKYVFDYETKSFFDEILTSQSKKYYKSDRKIRKTVASVIRNLACEGNVIIIGRGGVAITRDIIKSLHIMIEAPLEWRAARVSEKYCMKTEDAKKYAIEIDKKRKQFRDYFHGRGSDYTSFDIKFNAMTISIDEMAEGIIKMMQIRNLI
jgi:cytidylate kinase